MTKSFTLWKSIFANPVEGFKQVTPETKVGIPILAILVLSLLAGFVVVPIVTDSAYGDTMFRLVMKMTEAQGTQMGEAQSQGMRDYYKSDMGKIITMLQFPLGFLINSLIGIFLGALGLFVAGKIVKAEIDYGKALRITVFSIAVIWIGMIIKAGLALVADWRSALSNAESMLDLQGVISTTISLAAFFSSSSIGRIPFYIIDFYTDVFNIAYVLFIASGLSVVCGLKFGKAVVVSVIVFSVSFVIGLVSVLAIPM